MTPETLEESILWRLAADALLVFYSRAPRRHFRGARDITLVVSGEPVADLNYLLISGDDAAAREFLEECVDWCDARDLPFVSLVTPEAAASLGSLRERLGLDEAGAWPVMACPADAVTPMPVDGVGVERVVRPAQHAGLVEVLAGAYDMPAESVARAVPLSLYESPAIEAWIGTFDGEPLSSVTATWHGEVVGIWAMGTLPAAQRKGVGRALLSTMMSDCVARGAKLFFLGATPAGFPLYKSLGYRTVFEAPIWVRGETHQA